LRVLLAGEEVLRQETASLRLPLYSEGAYRVEVFLNGRYWIIANPFFVTRGSDQCPGEEDGGREGVQVLFDKRKPRLFGPRWERD